MHRFPRRPWRRSGLALALTIMVASIILVLAMGMSTMAQQNLNLVAADTNKSAAYYSAIAGCNTAIANLRANAAYAGCATTANGSSGSFAVDVTRPPATAADGTVVPSGFVYVLATGWSSPTGARAGVASARVGALIPQGSMPDPGSFGLQSIAGDNVDLPDAVVNTYSSNTTPDPTSYGGGALLVTNSTTSGAIDLTGPRGGATIQGTASSGVGSNPASVISGGTFTEGSPSALTSPRSFPPPVVPTALKSAATTTLGTVNSNITLTPGKYDQLDVAMNRTVTFAAGDYYFTGDVTTKKSVIFQNASIGAGVRIFVDGKVTFDKDNQVNYAIGTVPAKFAIFSTGTGVVQGDKNLKARFAVYAPQSDLSFHKDCEIWGAVIASTFDGRTGAATDYTRFHYDKALQGSGTSVSFEVAAVGSARAWRRD